MAIPSVAVGAPITSSEINQLAQTANSTGFVGIVPGSTNPGSGSVAVSPGGLVRFTNATNVSLNGCFTGAYDNYRVIINVSGRSASASLTFRLRQAGNDLTSASYNWIRHETSGTTTHVPVTATASTFCPVDLVAAAGQTADGYFEVYGPASATHTGFLGHVFAYGGSPLPYIWDVGMQNTASSASDGFTIYPDSGGNITGTLRIYAYNNLN